MNKLIIFFTLLTFSFFLSCSKTIVENELSIENAPEKFSNYGLEYYQLMEENQFWEIIELSLRRSDGTINQQLKELETELLKLTALELIQFNNNFTEKFNQAYDWEIWAACETMSSGGCGDTYFGDSFLPWLISRGKVTFHNALLDPESLTIVDPQKFRTNESSMESLDFVQYRAYRKNFGTLIPVGIHYKLDVKGERWLDETLPEKFPKLWKKFNSEKE